MNAICWNDVGKLMEKCWKTSFYNTDIQTVIFIRQKMCGQMLEMPFNGPLKSKMIILKSVILQEKGGFMPDSIARPTKFQIQGSIENLAVKTDSLSGTTSYYISVGSNEKSDTSQSPILWKGLFFSVLLLLFVGVIWISYRRKRSANPLPQPQNEQEAFLRNELFRQTDIYKECVRKGYYSVNRNTSLEVMKEQEIKELCDAVIKVYVSFSEFLREKALSDKDFQFCCLVKSGLTTFELAEIYCISESAIFKRKQRMKEKLGFSPDARTLDEILQRL